MPTSLPLLCILPLLSLCRSSLSCPLPFSLLFVFSLSSPLLVILIFHLCFSLVGYSLCSCVNECAVASQPPLCSSMHVHHQNNTTTSIHLSFSLSQSFIQSDHSNVQLIFVFLSVLACSSSENPNQSIFLYLSIILFSTNLFFHSVSVGLLVFFLLLLTLPISQFRCGTLDLGLPFAFCLLFLCVFFFVCFLFLAFGSALFVPWFLAFGLFIFFRCCSSFSPFCLCCCCSSTFISIYSECTHIHTHPVSLLALIHSFTVSCKHVVPFFYF